MTHPLRIEVERLRHGPIDLEFELPSSDLDLQGDAEYSFPDPVRGRLHAVIAGQGNVVLTGQITTTAEADCVRCLERLRFPLSVRIRQAWMPVPADPREARAAEEEDVRIYRGDIVRPADELREEIMLALPSIPRCPEKDSEACGARQRALHPDASPEKPAEDNPWKSQLAKVRSQLPPEKG